MKSYDALPSIPKSVFGEPQGNFNWFTVLSVSHVSIQRILNLHGNVIAAGSQG